MPDDTEAQTEARKRELELERWIDDLQSGMWINCVYCGHRYGPSDEHPATLHDEGPRSMKDALREHIAQCPEHPLSKAEAENASLREALRDMRSLVEQCQEITTSYLTPDGYDETDALHVLIGLLDGPKQRETFSKSERALVQEPRKGEGEEDG